MRSPLALTTPDHPSPPQLAMPQTHPATPPAPARKVRQLVKLTSSVSSWWAAIPEDRQRPYYALSTVAEATGYTPNQLGHAMRELGWFSVQVRLAGVATSVWVPPGYPSPLRARGRPRIHPRHPSAPHPAHAQQLLSTEPNR